jgi:hypothetical protein
LAEEGAKQRIAVLEEGHAHSAGEAVECPLFRARHREPQPEGLELGGKAQWIFDGLPTEPIEVDRMPVPELQRKPGAPGEVEAALAADRAESLQHGPLRAAERLGVQLQG